MTSVYDLKGKFQYGMHGLGFFKGTKHANTYDGLQYWLSEGVKFMEVDVAPTIDGQYVALAHMMKHHDLLRLEISELGGSDVYTHSWFMRQKLFGQTTKGLRPLDIAMIVDELRKSEHLMVMFDLYGMWTFEETVLFTKNLLNIIDRDKDLVSRMLVEAYNQEMIDGIKKASNGEISIIYCIHEDSAGAHHQFMPASTLEEQEIRHISYPWTYVKQYPGELEEYAAKDFIIVSLSKDNRYAKEMQRRGVNIALVDNIYHTKDFIVKYPQYLMERVKNLLVQRRLRT